VFYWLLGHRENVRRKAPRSAHGLLITDVTTVGQRSNLICAWMCRVVYGQAISPWCDDIISPCSIEEWSWRHLRRALSTLLRMLTCRTSDRRRTARSISIGFS